MAEAIARRRPRRLQIALLAALLLGGAVALLRSATRVREYRRVEAICAATDRGDWGAALPAPRPLSPTVPQLREADCRCVALLATGRGEDCYEVLETLLASPAIGDWLPRPLVTAALVEHRRTRGDLAGAARLARAGADSYPQVSELLFLESQLTTLVESPRAALETTSRRLAGASPGPATTTLRLILARQALDLEDPPRALAVLGDEPPPDASTRAGWYTLRMTAQARSGRPHDLAATARRWAAEPGRAARSFGLYAYLLSVTQQQDVGGVPTPVLLAAAVARGDAIGDAELLKGLYVRHVGTLAIGGFEEEALRAFDEATALFGDLGALDRDDLARTFEDGEDGLTPSAATGRVELRVDAPQPGDRLLLSPDPVGPRDAPFVSLPVPASGRVTVERAPDTWPLRWVLHDAGGHTRGSGAAWPAPGAAAVATVQRRPAASPPPPEPLRQRPAAGEPRLFVVILDCADWRFVQHGRARGELPVLDALVGEGRTAVVSSVPPFTASAMEALVHPGSAGVESVLGVLHHLGVELAGLSFVTGNPLAPLGWMLPEGTDLFAALGSGELRVANLLRSYGSMKLGRHGDVVGPAGARRQLPLNGPRPLLPAEESLIGQAATDHDRDLLADIAGDFDDIVQIARSEAADLVMLRVAALDLLTHRGFPQTARAGQDDGAAVLFGAYRYVDRRLGDLYRALDGNDVLLVMSDHGARTALEHDHRAFFVAAGGGILPGRIPGEPELRGVPRLLADFFAVPTDWPATGLDLPRVAVSGTAAR